MSKTGRKFITFADLERNSRFSKIGAIRAESLIIEGNLKSVENSDSPGSFLKVVERNQNFLRTSQGDFNCICLTTGLLCCCSSEWQVRPVEVKIVLKKVKY